MSNARYNLFPSKPAFLAIMDNTVTSHSGSSDYNDIFTDWTSIRYDIGSDFVLSSGRFTAPVDGLYLFNAAIIMNNGDQPNNDWAGLNLLINGTALSHNLAAFGDQSSSSENYNNKAYQLNLVMDLSAADYVELSMDSLNGTGQIFRGSFSGTLVS